MRKAAQPMSTLKTTTLTSCVRAWLFDNRRYRKKVEKDDDYLKQITNLASAVEGDIKQNYSIDIYQVCLHGHWQPRDGHDCVRSIVCTHVRADEALPSQEYFAGESATDYSSTPPSAKTLAVFKDPNEVCSSCRSFTCYP